MDNKPSQPWFDPKERRLECIFLPYATKQRQKLFPDEGKNESAQFVHYTSADAALSIITKKAFWMRNTMCMADFREVQHGFDILQSFFADEEKRKRFVASFDDCHPGVAQNAIDTFNTWWSDIRHNTYITSISEHDRREDLHGRLSMWRAFGNQSAARVAIILNVPRATDGVKALRILFGPVSYLPTDNVHEVFQEVEQNVKNNCDFLRSVERQHVLNYLFTQLLWSVCCLKHEGFHEEREWRAIYSPNRTPSTFMKGSTEIIGGIPQTVYKLPLDSKNSPALADIDLSRIFERLIIGPSQYSWPLAEAFVSGLKEVGIQDAEKRVFVSGIPIRT